MIEYGPDASRTPADAGLQASLLRINIQMERDEGEGGRAGRYSDSLIFNLALGLCHI